MPEIFRCQRLAQSREGVWRQASLCSRDITSLPRRMVEAARHSGHDLKPFSSVGMVLHLADKTSASTTSPANNMLAKSENVACNGCAWKWRPRSVRVRMASLPAEENGILNTTSRPCDTNSLSKLDSKSTRIAVITGPSRRSHRQIASDLPNPYPATPSALITEETSLEM